MASLPTAPDNAEEFYIANAGQVLLAPWLPRLFEAAGLLSEGDFADREAAEKAVRLLQYAVNGEFGSPEFRLVLNKILCGVPQDAPLQRPESIDESAAALVEQLLKELCTSWPGLEGTSPSGLQGSFLQREGRLRWLDDSWQLLVEEQAFDMLLDRVPWAFRSIRLGWMNQLVQVSWR